MAHLSTPIETRLVRAAYVLWAVGALAVFGGLAYRTSANPVVLGRYGLRYALLVGVMGLVFIGLVGITVRVWKQPTGLISRVRRIAPSDLALLSAILGAVVGVLLLMVLPRFANFLNSSFIRIGIGCWLAGGLLVLYAAARSGEEGARLWGLGARFKSRTAALVIVGCGCLLLGGWWVWSFALIPSTTLFDDELLNLAYASTHPLFSSFFQRDYLPASFYRPPYDVEAGVFYLLFGTNFAAWHLGQAFLLLVSVVLFFVVLVRVGVRPYLAVLLAMAFGSLPAVVIQLSWAIDTVTVLASMTILVLLLLNEHADRPLWYVGLAVVLLVCPFLKEYGLAVIGGVMVCALEGMRTKQFSRRQGLVTLGIALGVTVIYFGLRQSIVGPLGDSIQNSSGYLFRPYSYAELVRLEPLQRVVFHVYTILAHLVGDFVAIFGLEGVLDLAALPLSFALLATLGLFVGMHKWVAPKGNEGSADERWRLKLAGAGLVCAGVGFLLTVWIGRWQNNLNILAQSAQTCISVGMFLGVWFCLPHKSKDRLLALYAVCLIFIISVLGFSYYHERHHYISGIGWIILLGLVLKHTDTKEWGRALGQALVFLTVLLVVSNSMRAHEAIVNPKVPYAFETGSTLCKPFFPEPLARRIAEQWQLDLVQLETCRSAASPAPSN